jgi:Ca2+-binding RTX toxin-like protein
MLGILARFLKSGPLSEPANVARMEPLEGRQLMSGSIALSPFGSLNIVGTNAADAVTVNYDTRGTLSLLDDQVRVSMSHPALHDKSHLASFSALRVRNINFFGLAGNDFFVNNTAIRSTALGGSGDDVLHGGGGADRLIGDDGNDKLFGRGGKDVLEGRNGNDFLDTGAEFIPGDAALGQAGFDTFKNRFGDIRDRAFFEPLV